MNFQVVKDLVAYARSIEKEKNKNFRFTLTTNGMLIDDEVIAPICHLKTEHLKSTNPRLHSDETLLALAVSSRGNAIAAQLMDSINKLKGCDAHFSVIISPTDENLYRTLGINVSCEPKFEQRRFYHK